MRALTNREKRTIRIATVAIVIYLAFFGGLQGWKSVSKKRSDYLQLVKEAQRLSKEIEPYQNKALLVQKLMESFHMDPTKAARATLVAEASAAIQKAAAAGGIRVGPVREESGRGAGKELATIKLEGSGPVPAVMALLHRLESLGYPLVVESVQIGSETGRPMGAMGAMGPMGPMPPMGSSGPPGMVKVSLTILILDFQQWKNEEAPHA